MKMKLPISLFAMLCICAAQTHAQFTVLGSSPPFPEYEFGRLKILTLKNGYSVLLHAMDKTLNLKTYNADYKLVAEKPITLKAKFGWMSGVFLETDANVTVLYTTFKEWNTPALCRIVIDPSNGAVLSDEFLSDFGEYSNFDVRKDEAGESYAVAFHNSSPLDRKPDDKSPTDKYKRPQIIHYNNQSKVISRASPQPAADNHQHVLFLDMVVSGDEEVIVSFLGKNTTSSDDEDGALLLGRLKGGADILKLNKIAYPNAGLIQEGLLKYHAPAARLYLLTIENQGKKRSNLGSTVTHYFGVRLSTISGDNSINIKPVTTAKIDEIATERKKEGFMAIPQNLFVNDDGSYVILFEEKKVKEDIATIVYHNDVGMVNYDQFGNELSAAYIPKSHVLVNMIDENMSNSKIMLKGSGGEKQFKSFLYIHAEKEYMLFNDIAENQNKVDENKSVTAIKSVDDAEAFYFALQGDVGIPKRVQVFPSDAKVKTLVSFASADYNRDTRILTILTTSRQAKGPKSKVVWIKVN